MAITSRSAQNPCIYWAQNHCIAVAYFIESSISCYNSGACDSAGTCEDCSRYDGQGLKLSTLSKEDQDRISDTDPLTNSQTPMNVAIYNIRATMHKCCNWDGATVTLSVNSEGQVAPVISSDGIVGTTKTKCKRVEALDWQVPWKAGSLNTSKFPCNGAKSECPYYTGPKFKYIVDSKMEKGQSVSAAQIMELRYYSCSWTGYTDPSLEYKNRFSVPTLWAWAGDFDDAVKVSATELSSIPTELSLPRLVPVTLFGKGTSAVMFESALSIGVPVIAQPGTLVEGGPPNFPTLIKELKEFTSMARIVWPQATSTTSPFVFRSFRIGLNDVYVIVAHNTTNPIYAVNMTKNPQTSGITDEAFISDIQENHPDDIYISEAAPGDVGVVFDIDLEYSTELNVIKIFTAKDGSSDGSMYTDTCYVQHKFYHAHPAQTSFHDYAGQAVVEPWIDRFVDFSAGVELKALSKNDPVPSAVLWDSVAYNKMTIYETENIVEEWIQTWWCVYCNLVALEIADTNINAIQSWKISGHPTAPYISTTKLGIWIDRNGNPNVPDSQRHSLLEFQLVDRSTDGSRFPPNIIFVSPLTDISGFDKQYDRFKVVFAYTEYKQGPIIPSDISKLKYPQDYQKYISIMPYKIDFTGGNRAFSVSGISIPTKDISGNYGVRLSFRDFEDVIQQMETLSDANEKVSIESFVNGGDKEDRIEYLGVAYYRTRDAFDKKYTGLFFENGQQVSLENLCALLSSAGYYEGTQEYRIVFNDETGRPVGLRRLYLLMQSVVPSCRDVEIYYQWKSQGAFVSARDQEWLLADFYKPMLRSNAIREFVYTPTCGDHSLQVSGQTFYTKYTARDDTLLWETSDYGDLRARFDITAGDSGPMWYPYKACSTPRYDRTDPMEDYVLCQGFVEGFQPGARRAFWEATRGPDIYWSVRLGPLFWLGCTWSWVDGDYQTIKDPVFVGFTRVRSGHLFGPYQTDRESVRISRHYIKRNLAVRNELVRQEGSSGVVSLSDEGSSLLFYGDGVTPRQDEKPIWTHLVDDISVVNRTTPYSKHPFSNITMISEGEQAITEIFDSTRRTMKEVMQERDLVRANDRDEHGNLVYNVSEPAYQESEGLASFTSGKDIYWLYRDPNVVWSWMERHKSPDRAVEGPTRIGGVFLYNPTTMGWKKDMESATCSTEGVHDLVYTAPSFNVGTGALESKPTISWAGGPPREIDWYTGQLGGIPASYGGKDPYDRRNHTSTDGSVFVLFTDFTTVISGVTFYGFLADNSGLQTFENEGVTYKTFRGLSVHPDISIMSLPYANADALVWYNTEKQDIYATQTIYKEKSYTFSLRGYKYVSDISVTASFGIDGDTIYSFPAVHVDGKLFSGVWQSDILNIPTKVSNALVSTVTQTTSVSTVVRQARYTDVRIRFSPTPQRHLVRIDDIRLNIKDPINRTEKVKSYEQKISVSRGYTGNRAHSDLMYYYGRTFADFGLNDVVYDEVSNKQAVSQDLKWTSRTVRDIIPMFYFMDPTGTVFDFPNSAVTNIAGISAAVGGPRYIEGPLKIYGKGQTVLTTSHVTDPIDAVTAGFSWSSTVASDECSTCPNAKVEGIRDEYLQECLYKEAAHLSGKSITSTFVSFWHPDEIAFFMDTVGIPDMPSWSLVMESRAAPFSRVMRSPGYGCEEKYTNEYYDGRVHRIPPWRALGHLMYLGNPVWNWTCTDVIMNKVGIHLGETLFEYSPSDYVSSRVWPPDSITNVKIEEESFYTNNPKYWDNPATYTGGVMSQGIPTNIYQAMNYSPGGVPRGWLTELALFPQTLQWPLGDDYVIQGYRRFGKK